ncbi:MAG: hypothetical protein KF900_01190 [Bacteroidetes bacterium]|nr:hypothetical protein [Bacteroidota bacterium]
MLFTVFQYMVIIEEEVPHRKMELVKKQKSDTGSGGGNGDFPADEDPANEEIPSGYDDTLKGFYENSYFDFYSSASFHSYHSKPVFYSHLTEKINTPPPKV